jgi:rubrerythrin
MSQFSIDEIFEIAEQIERNGAKFYRTAADTLPDKGQQAMLLELAKMEDEHERIFAQMRKQLVTEMKRESVYESDDLAAQYLWAWANKAVFDMDVDPLQVLNEGAGVEDILKVAIGREKDSIVYYEGLKGGVSAEEDKSKVQAIQNEEMLHVALLTRKLEEIRG